MDKITSIDISIQDPQLLKGKRNDFLQLVEGLTLNRSFDQLGSATASDPGKPYFRSQQAFLTLLSGYLERWQDKVDLTAEMSSMSLSSLDQEGIATAHPETSPATILLKKHLYTTHLWEGFEAELSFTLIKPNGHSISSTKAVIVQLTHPQYFYRGQWKLEFSYGDEYDDLDRDRAMLAIQRDSWSYQQLPRTVMRDKIPTYLGMFHRSFNFTFKSDDFSQTVRGSSGRRIDLFAMILDWPGEIVDLAQGSLEDYLIPASTLLKCYQLYDDLNQLNILHDGSLSQINFFLNKATGDAKIFNFWNAELADDYADEKRRLRGHRNIEAEKARVEENRQIVLNRKNRPRPLPISFGPMPDHFFTDFASPLPTPTESTVTS
ncbi:uncharacterized protein I303_105093 [Kwoniella dejecticola CBS 10117]|uniref:Uncharacterized protein n=1 Tax=Kwoniella dejecticola CBS 10117 TaxID=1296121 RepID=A0A1A6A3G7_9TREE|nr:uncharacterized protein I303_05462 [Kwoniella dejecticola CBS 10117]OBR84603.1 hypothetical protein I303_05462 [Kwoniella dejecticola CBS 10117]